MRVERRRTDGLSLIEILVALAIFVIGILALLKVFTSGLGLVQTFSDSNVAVHLGESWLNTLRAEEGRLPRMILPAGRPTQTDPSQPDFGSLRLSAALADVRPYDLGQPHSGQDPTLLYRMMSQERLVVGERVTVPRGMAFDSAGQTVRATMPYHCLFGPIAENIDDAGRADAAVFRDFHRVEPIELQQTIVDLGPAGTPDLRYRDRPVFAFEDGGLDPFTGTPAPDKVLFELDTEPRLFVVTLAYRDVEGLVRWVQAPPLRVPLSGNGPTPNNPPDDPVVRVDLGTYTEVLPGSVKVRQVIAADATPGDAPSRFEYGDNGYTHGVLRFPVELAGESLSLEYVVADWRFLREVVTVDVDSTGTIQTSPNGPVLPGGLLQVSRDALDPDPTVRPRFVVSSSGQQLAVDTARWDNDPTLAGSGKIPLDLTDPANILPMLQGTQEVLVFYRREGNWAMATAIAPQVYLLEDDLGGWADPLTFPNQSVLVRVDEPVIGSDTWCDLWFRPSEGGRAVAVTYEVDLPGGGRETVAGELQVVPPQANRDDAGQPRHAIRLRRPNVAHTTVSLRPLIHSIEGRSLHVRVAYDDDNLDRDAAPSPSVSLLNTGPYLSAERLVELNWYVRRQP